MPQNNSNWFNSNWFTQGLAAAPSEWWETVNPANWGKVVDGIKNLGAGLYHINQIRNDPNFRKNHAEEAATLDAIIHHYQNYTSWNGFKQNWQHDPVGTAQDIGLAADVLGSLLLEPETGGLSTATLGAGLTGMAAKLGFNTSRLTRAMTTLSQYNPARYTRMAAAAVPGATQLGKTLRTVGQTTQRATSPFLAADVAFTAGSKFVPQFRGNVKIRDENGNFTPSFLNAFKNAFGPDVDPESVFRAHPDLEKTIQNTGLKPENLRTALANSQGISLPGSSATGKPAGPGAAPVTQEMKAKAASDFSDHVDGIVPPEQHQAKYEASEKIPGEFSGNTPSRYILGPNPSRDFLTAMNDAVERNSNEAYNFNDLLDPKGTTGGILTSDGNLSVSDIANGTKTIADKLGMGESISLPKIAHEIKVNNGKFLRFDDSTGRGVISNLNKSLIDVLQEPSFYQHFNGDLSDLSNFIDLNQEARNLFAAQENAKSLKSSPNQIESNKIINDAKTSGQITPEQADALHAASATYHSSIQPEISPAKTTFLRSAIKYSSPAIGALTGHDILSGSFLGLQAGKLGEALLGVPERFMEKNVPSIPSTPLHPLISDPLKFSGQAYNATQNAGNAPNQAPPPDYSKLPPQVGKYDPERDDSVSNTQTKTKKPSNPASSDPLGMPDSSEPAPTYQPNDPALEMPKPPVSGSANSEPEPPDPTPQASGGRIERASGGKVDADAVERLVGKLMFKVNAAKNVSNKATEPLLNKPDDAIVKALEVAQRAI